MVVPHKCHKLRKIFPQEAFRSLMTIAYNLYEYSLENEIPKELKDLIDNKDFQNFTQMMNRVDPLLKDSNDKTDELVKFVVAGIVGYTLDDLCHGTSRKTLNQLINHKFEREMQANTKRMISKTTKAALYEMLSIKPKNNDDPNNNETTKPSNNDDRNNNSKDKSKNSNQKDRDIYSTEVNFTALAKARKARADRLKAEAQNAKTTAVKPDDVTNTNSKTDIPNLLANDVVDNKILCILRTTEINFLPKTHSHEVSDELFEQIAAINTTQFSIKDINFKKMQSDLLENLRNSSKYDEIAEKIQKLHAQKEEIQQLEIISPRKKSIFDRKAYNARLVREARRSMYFDFGKRIDRKISLREAKKILRMSKMPEFHHDKNYDDNYEFRNNTIWDKIKQTVKSTTLHSNDNYAMTGLINKKFIYSIKSRNYGIKIHDELVESLLHNMYSLNKKIEIIKNPPKKIFNQITILKKIRTKPFYKIKYYQELDGLLFFAFRNLKNEIMDDILDHDWDAASVRRKKAAERAHKQRFMNENNYGKASVYEELMDYR